MSDYHLEQGAVAKNLDERLVNLVASYEADTENPERGTMLWLLLNLQHARAALREAAKHGGQVRTIAERGLEVVGE